MLYKEARQMVLGGDIFVKSNAIQKFTYDKSGSGVRGSGERMMSEADHAAYLKANPYTIHGSDEWIAENQASLKALLNGRNTNFQHHDAPSLSYADYFSGVMTGLYEDSLLGKGPEVRDIESYGKSVEYMLKSVLEHEGIELNDNEKFYITAKDGKRIISGLDDNEKQKRIEEALNTSHIIGKDYTANAGGLETLSFINTDWAKEGTDFVDSQLRAILTQKKPSYAKELKDLTGIDFDLSKIYLDEDGVISGYPPELEQALGNGWNPNTRVDGINLSQKGMQVHHILERIGSYGYENIPDMDESDVYLSYSNKEGLSVLNK